jgi:hypothetical protein
MPKPGGKPREPVTPPEILSSPVHQQQPLDSVQAGLLLAVGELKGTVAQIDSRLKIAEAELTKISHKVFGAEVVTGALGVLAGAIWAIFRFWVNAK